MTIDDTTTASGDADRRLHSLFLDCETSLTSVRETLAEMVRDLSDGTGGNIRDISAKHRELETALMRAIETEQKYHDWKAKRDGQKGHRPDDFDLDAARHQIGCRLARLRECCRED